VFARVVRDPTTINAPVININAAIPVAPATTALIFPALCILDLQIIVAIIARIHGDILRQRL
jgi:hypothetical protein